MIPSDTTVKNHLSTVVEGLAGDFFGGLIHVNVRQGGRSIFDDMPAPIRAAEPVPDALPHGYPPNLAELGFDERVRELARPRLVPVFRDGATAREPEWRRNDGETWAREYVAHVARHAASPRRNLFALDPALTNQAPRLERELFRRKGQADPVEELFLETRVAYAKSVALALQPNPLSNRADRELQLARSQADLARLQKAAAVDDSFGDATGAAAKRRHVADLELRGVLLRTEIETIDATEQLDGDARRVCEACARIGFQGPGAFLLRATLDALRATEPTNLERGWLGRFPRGHRFDAVLDHLKRQALDNAAEPRLMARSIALGRELQAINELEAQERWAETQARCLALWQQINAEPSAEAAK